MRFRQYKCANGGKVSSCRYEWNDNEDNPCKYCGVKYSDAETVWDKLINLYQTVVPFEFRPPNAWYTFKCWAWKRYTTIKPRTLGHRGCDKTELIPHMMFELLCQFVEQELRVDEYVDWDATEHHAAARDEMEALYKWWHEEHLPTEDSYEVTWGSMNARDALLLENCRRIVTVSPYMWT